MSAYTDTTHENEIHLLPLLDDFCNALRDEIEAAKRNSSISAIHLSNGHKVAQLGSAFQYAFLIDSVLNTPDGAPGDLKIPGKMPLETTIVSAEGLRLVVSINTDLGQFIPTANLQTNLTILMRKLIERIEKNASNTNPAASRMLGESPVNGEPKLLEKLPHLNEDQQKALHSAIGRNLTFIWGPPGTGKTRTIGTITEYLHREKRTVLIVSHTNTAVDQAIKHVASTIHNQLPEGVLLRIGEVRDEELTSDYPDVLLKNQVDLQSKELSGQRDKLQSQKQILEDRLTPFENQISVIEWIAESNSTILTIQKQLEKLHSNEKELSSLMEEQAKLKETSEHIAVLRKEINSYPSIYRQKLNILELSAKIGSLASQIANQQASCNDAEKIFMQTSNTGALMRFFKRLPKPEDQQANVINLKKQIADLVIEHTKVQDSLKVNQKVLNRTETLIAEVSKYEKNQRLRSDTIELRGKLSSTLANILKHLSIWELIYSKPTDVEEMLALVLKTHSEVAAKFADANLSMLKERVSTLRSEIARLSSEISRIEGALSQVEKAVIAKASIIGATLTKTYLSDDIQARKFDTVILDEASMAPIPALWVAALLADKNLIIVGDFKQLPPIVLSNNALTKKWLGEDIFQVSGVRALWEKQEPPDYFIPLTEQRRMLPQIAEIANQFYDGILRTPVNLHGSNYEELYQWFNKDWGHDKPVLLVDTGSLNAWVTSVVKNGKGSRLNFLSATVAVDLAEQLLRQDRPKRQEGGPKRILIISPYRAHAKLVSVLIKENIKIIDDVIAGTAHSFQGSEANVVIFDLVADEPHWRVNLFMPDLDEQLKSLLNVGLTRAKFRLIILGDFEYCQSHGKKAFLGKTLIPFLLKNYPRTDAAQLFPEGLAAKAAKAQMSMLGGAIEPDSDRIVVTQADFYRILSADFSHANNRIVLYSPFITQDRTTFLLPQLQAAAERNISIFVLTKSYSERSKSELQQYRKLETQLSEIGAVVIHKLRMHEKLVFIDNDITWSGSLNPLSFSNTQEIMERRKSVSVLQDYFKILRLEELLSVPGKPESKCPICSSEMIAAEGDREPYYWRCVNDDCYSRSIDQPYPIGGMLTCKSCNSKVEFGYWGDYPHWRCSSNTKHRQKVFKSHLRLPIMAALIPKAERKKVCEIFGIDNFDSFVISDKRHKKESNIVQTNLIDDDK
ncbi:MAG TPA: AAA domain-containing protein [Candidatus Methanoperedens sp.]|nr:AAA domain-containing protein [Candidatus Methanoperedens sp.]